MPRQPNDYEKKLFEIVREYNGNFYYSNILKTVNDEKFKISVEKKREEMVGIAHIDTDSGEKIDYEIRYNRIINLINGYTLHVPGIKNG